jgi:hypothetical protein
MMAKQYQGKPVRSWRPAREGDDEFVKDTGQVVVTLEDGTEKTVEGSEVKDKPTEGGQK